MVHVIKKGLDIPISGSPVQEIGSAKNNIRSVGIVGDDYHGMRPTMLVGVGDKVKIGQPVMSDKKNEGVLFVSPACGTVRSINRGEKRKFLSMVIDVEGNDEVTFDTFSNFQVLGYDAVKDHLLATGMWPAFRTRPYSKSPAPGSVPRSIFVNAMDTNPLSAEPELIIDRHREHFVSGLSILTNLLKQPESTGASDSEAAEETEGESTGEKKEAHVGKVFVCAKNHSHIPGVDIDDVELHEFKGPHPAGLSGTHIHVLDPVNENKVVWTIGYQDVIAIGHLFTTGRVMTERTVALGGPIVRKPRLITTQLGACLDDIVEGELSSRNARVVSGSVLTGRKSEEHLNYLGRYHCQVSAIEEGTHREFLGWQKPGFDKFTVTRLYVGSILKKTFNMTSNINGGHRSMVPIGTYERVMPLDILPTQLLRALLSGDTEQAQALGCLELDEEDLALCTFVCPGKYDYGSTLRENLTVIEKEG